MPNYPSGGKEAGQRRTRRGNPGRSNVGGNLSDLHSLQQLGCIPGLKLYTAWPMWDIQPAARPSCRCMAQAVVHRICGEAQLRQKGVRLYILGFMVKVKFQRS